MKHTFFFGLVLLLGIGCKQNPPSAPPPPSANVPGPAAEKAPAAPSGTYLVDEFLSALTRTQSPYAVSKMGDYPLFGFTFTPTRLNGFTVHEGGYDTDLTYDSTGRKYVGKAIPGVEAFEFTVEPGGAIRLTFLTSGKTFTYHPVPDIDSAVRKALFEGQYTDKKTRKPVAFNADGTLTGLGADKTYQVVYDYMGGPLDFDEVIIADTAANAQEKYYHYKFKENTLELYEAIQPKNGQGKEKIGGLRYTLLKN